MGMVNVVVVVGLLGLVVAGCLVLIRALGRLR